MCEHNFASKIQCIGVDCLSETECVFNLQKIVLVCNWHKDCLSIIMSKQEDKAETELLTETEKQVELAAKEIPLKSKHNWQDLLQGWQC